MLFFPLTWKDFFFFPFSKEKGRSKFSAQVTAKQGLEPELPFQPQRRAETHQRSRAHSAVPTGAPCAARSPFCPICGQEQAAAGPSRGSFGVSGGGDGAWALMAFWREIFAASSLWFVLVKCAQSLPKPLWVRFGAGISLHVGRSVEEVWRAEEEGGVPALAPRGERRACLRARSSSHPSCCQEVSFLVQLFQGRS